MMLHIFLVSFTSAISFSFILSISASNFAFPSLSPLVIRAAVSFVIKLLATFLFGKCSNASMIVSNSFSVSLMIVFFYV